MPKIVVKVQRTAHTRSKSQAASKVEEEAPTETKQKNVSKESTPIKKTIKIEA